MKLKIDWLENALFLLVVQIMNELILHAFYF